MNDESSTDRLSPPLFMRIIIGQEQWAWLEENFPEECAKIKRLPLPLYGDEVVE